MNLRRAFVFAFAALALACGRTAAPEDSGIEGVALVGPTCPVVRVDEPCPDRPIEATLEVVAGGSGERTEFRTGADGRFRIPLPPGDYVIKGLPPNGAPLPRGEEQTVTVEPHRFTQVTVRFDSGIR